MLVWFAAVAAPFKVPRLNVGVEAKPGRLPLILNPVFAIEPPAWNGVPSVVLIVISSELVAAPLRVPRLNVGVVA